MLALLLTIGLFAGWTVIGYALLHAFGNRVGVRLPRLQALLVAPVFGWSLTLVAVLLLNRADVPVRIAGPVVWIAALAGAGAVAWRFGLPVPWRQALPAAAGLLVGLGLVAWPMALYGFDWLGYANDDMANYVLAGHRHYHHGFFRQPLLAEILGTDYSQYYWFMHVTGEMRPGSEVHVALVMSLTGLSGAQSFMPLICALHLSLLGAIAALAFAALHSRRAIVVSLLLAGSWPLLVYGANYQLIAQVGGLALLMTAIALIPPYLASTDRRWVGPAVLLGIVSSALLVTYSEVLPFLIGTCGLVGLVALWRRRTSLRTILLRAVALMAAVVAMLLGAAYNALNALAQQGSGGMKTNTNDTLLFPYYMTPDGFGYLWGGLAIGGQLGEVAVALAVVVGMILVGWAAVRSLNGLLRAGDPACACLLVMLALAGMLFAKRVDFGLYKLAMFMAPVLVVLLTGLLMRQRTAGRAAAIIGLAVLLIGWQLHTTVGYVRDGALPGGRRSEIQGGSTGGLISAIARSDGLEPLDNLSTNVVAAKLIATGTIGRSAPMVAKDFVGNILDFRTGGSNPLYQDYRRYAKHLGNQRPNYWRSTVIAGRKIDYFLREATAPIGLRTAHETPFDPDGAMTSGKLLRATRPPVSFLVSNLGQHYYLPRDRKAVSFYQAEPDIFLGQGTFHASGRQMLLRLAPEVDGITVHATATANKATACRFPSFTLSDAAQAGSGSPAVFRGSGRVRLAVPRHSSSSSSAAVIALLDAGFEPQQMLRSTPWMSRLYNAHINPDPRWLTHFLRTIHADPIPATAPAALRRFPDDLRDPALCYCGLYEDGWVGERCWVELGAGRVASLRGEVPGLPELTGQSATVSIAGRIVARRPLAAGTFTLRVPADPGAARQRIDIEFARHTTLAAPDSRPIAAKLHSITMEP